MSSKYTILAHCQYRENYAASEGGFRWKDKGEHIFSFEVDFCDWMYDSETIEQAAKMVIANECNDHEAFEVLGFTVQLEKPTNITAKIKAQYKEFAGK